jgi:signal transduction histidine kinase
MGLPYNKKRYHIKPIALLYGLCCCPLFFWAQAPIRDSVSMAIEKKATAFAAETNFKKAQVFFFKKKWDSVLVYAMQQLSTGKVPELVPYSYYLRAIGFKRKKLLQEAKSTFANIPSSFPFYYSVIINLYEIELELGNFTQARYYFEQVEKMPNSGVYDFKKSAFYHNVGLYYLHQGRFDTAANYLFKSLGLQEAEKDTLGLIASYMDIGNLYYEQFKDGEAIPYFEKAYRLAKQSTSFELKKTAAENMAVVEENRKNLPASLAYRKEYEAWKDSLNDQHKVWALAELEKEFAVQQKQKEVNVLATQNKLKIAERNGFIYTSALLVALLATGIYFYRQKVKQNTIIAAQKKELNELNAAKDRLFSIVSHDLRSSVQAVKSSTAQLLENLNNNNVTELRKLLNENSAIANSTYHLLDNLLHWALLQTQQSYFKQEALRLHYIVEHTAFNYKPLMLGKNLQFHNRVSDALLVLVDEASLKIVLRNVLDNAIKFSQQDGSIAVYDRPGPAGFCQLIIADNGKGMSDAMRQALLQPAQPLNKQNLPQLEGTGLGLQLCQSLIQKNGGTFTIESKEHSGTQIIITLPITDNHG